MTECIEHFLRPSNYLLLNSQIKSDLLIKETDEVDNVDYRLECARLNSFKNWPCPWVKPEKLAASGFYYTGETDKVKCFECQIEICQWQADDNPMVDHQRWSGKCRFVRNIPCGNVPIGTDPNTIPEPVPKGIDVCGPYGVVYMPFSGPDNDLPNEMTFNFGELSATRPKHPEFASYDDRLRTFETWPRAMSQTKEELATAGFYYTGSGDQTLCYHCGGGLRDWEPEDNVWEQHAKWFDYCPYLLMVKGRDFVSRVTRRTYFTPETYNLTENAVVKTLSEKIDNESIANNSSQNSITSDDTGIESAGSSAGSSAESTAGSSAGSDAKFITESCEGSIEGEPIVKCEKPVDKDARMCKICYNRELRMLFYPCGHLLACAECAKDMKTCGVCRKPVSLTVQAFIA